MSSFGFYKYRRREKGGGIIRNGNPHPLSNLFFFIIIIIFFFYWFKKETKCGKVIRVGQVTRPNLSVIESPWWTVTQFSLRIWLWFSKKRLAHTNSVGVYCFPPFSPCVTIRRPTLHHELILIFVCSRKLNRMYLAVTSESRKCTKTQVGIDVIFRPCRWQHNEMDLFFPVRIAHLLYYP